MREPAEFTYSKKKRLFFFLVSAGDADYVDEITCISSFSSHVFIQFAPFYFSSAFDWLRSFSVKKSTNQIDD